MHLFSASQQPWAAARLPHLLQPAAPRAMAGRQGKPEICGWYDSSFDLAQGLEVSEHDSHTLYQLWELSQP